MIPFFSVASLSNKNPIKIKCYLFLYGKQKGKQIISLLDDLVYKIVFSCFLPINT